jgi:cell division protein FtsL
MDGEKADRKIAVRRLSLIVSIVAVLFMVISLRVWQEMQVVKLGYQLNQLKAQVNQALDKQRILLSRRNSLASLERIEYIARQEMGLVTPVGDQIIFLKDPAAPEQQHQPWSLWQWLSRLLPDSSMSRR